MIVDFGYYALLAALCLTVYVVVAFSFSIQRNSRNLFESARLGVIISFGLVLAAYLALTYAFLQDDFTVRFVAHHSSTDLPTFYKLTAVWAGMEGSLLLWELILGFFFLVVVWRYQQTSQEVLPYIGVVLGLISVFLLFLLVGWSNPLLREFPAPTEGFGMNPLLQNPGMVYHPPTLYLGYVGFSIPFAFAIGSMMRGRFDNQWILTTRRWTLFSWFFLTVGIVLGAQWAYVELGWGGYWAWDPVENSSLMPWLTGTAFLHSVIVQEKRDHLRIWNMMLIIATFTLTILGTFITRSGVLGSVHAFAKSNVGPAFLVFIAVVLVCSIVLLLYRQPMLSSKMETAGVLCKENAFLLNNVVFLTMTFTVLYGTVFPLLAEGLAGTKLSIQAPFFNTVMAPMAMVMVLLMGITHLLGWKKTSASLLNRAVLLPLLIVVVFMGVLSWMLEASWQFAFLTGSTLFAGILVVKELIRLIRFRREKVGSGDGGRGGFLKAMVKDGRRRGGLLIHLGIVMMMLGVCGAYFDQETAFTFSPGEERSFGGYQLKHGGDTSFFEHNARHQGINIAVYRDGRPIGTLTPVKAFYPTSSQPMTEVAVRRTLKEDLYIILASMNDDGSTTITVYINPLVNFIWISMIVITIGTLYSLSYRPVQLRSIRLPSTVG
jgi:cytochrome c-type biogenesis protein CcmF